MSRYYVQVSSPSVMVKSHVKVSSQSNFFFSLLLLLVLLLFFFFTLAFYFCLHFCFSTQIRSGQFVWVAQSS
ncbi:hypothetical protein VIGAN_03109100 [Vigna angularis var. angularis]|uniref:Uncharacterized protein n=1 Tax=Vigna angularis var. angularis TaxID=157739 RepID=A0A0S3RLB2_PHAAN|nr:hypothetical protein VIGAN_03109100 [Vigna angularis var. angularis]